MKTVPLGDLCNITIGRTPARADSSMWGGDHPWVSIRDMGQGSWVTSTAESISDRGAVGGRVVEPGTVLFSFKLSIGKVARAGIPLYTNEAIAALPVRDSTVLDAAYLTRALARLDYSRDSNRAVMGATLNKRSLEEMRIPLPGLEEQRRIAAILDQADAIRAKRRQALAYLEILPQSLLNELSRSINFGLVKAETVISDLRNGVSPSTRGSVAARVLTLSAITRGRFDIGASKVGMFDTDPPVDKRVRAGEYLMCRGNGNRDLVGIGAFSLVDHVECVFPDTMIAGRLDGSMVNVEYFDALWSSEWVRGQLRASARTTSGIYKINQKIISNIMLPIPSMSIQEEFAKQVRLIDAQRERVERQLAADDELFASLQARAFRGHL